MEHTKCSGFLWLIWGNTHKPNERVCVDEEREIKVVKRKKYVLYRGKSINTLFIALPFGTNDHSGRLTVHTIHILNEAQFCTHAHRHRRSRTRYIRAWKVKRGSRNIESIFYAVCAFKGKIFPSFFPASSDPDEIDSNFLFCNRVCTIERLVHKNQLLTQR